MSLIKSPAEIQEKKNLVMMIYGTPGAGKTSLALSAPSPVLIDTDGGVSRTHTAHRCPTVQVTKWEDVNAALDEIQAGPYRSIIVDTVGKLLDFMGDFIIRNNSKMRKFDGTLSLQGYGVRKQMFREFIKRCMLMGRNVIFVAHASEDKVDEQLVVRPIVGGSSMADIMMELDLLGLLDNIGGKRLLLWGNDGTTGYAKSFYAKNTCFLPNVMEVPVVADAQGNIIRANDFLTGVLATYGEAQKKKEETNAAYEKLVAECSERIAACKNDKDLNKLRAEFGGEQFAHIYDSKLVTGQKLMAKAKELGYVFSKVDSKFVKANASA